MSKRYSIIVDGVTHKYYTWFAVIQRAAQDMPESSSITAMRDDRVVWDWRKGE